jgi:hypothetical protein
MKAARNIAIIAAVAALIALAPGGGAAADAVFTALSMAFLWALGVFAYRFYRENQMTIATLGDGRRALLLGSLGMLGLLIAGSPKMFATGPGTLAWFVLLGLSLFAMVRVWMDAQSYT